MPARPVWRWKRPRHACCELTQPYNTDVATEVCKLCLQSKPLQDSHLIPAAMYDIIRRENIRSGWENPSPIAIGKTVTSHTSQQVTDYVLCADCEDLFNKKGERWMIQQVWNGTSFLLLDRLNLAHPQYPFRDALVFSGTSVGIDVDKLGYFALSVFWRAGVHVWNVGFGQKSTKLDLGTSEEPLRLFLLGQGPLPQNLVLVSTVCIDPQSMGTFMTPGRRQGKFFPNVSAFGVTTLGVHFMLFLGPLPASFQDLCCLQSASRHVFLRDCQNNTLDAYKGLMASSKVARNVQQARRIEPTTR